MSHARLASMTSLAVLAAGLSACSSAMPAGPMVADGSSTTAGPCAGMTFDDRTAASADRTVGFGGALGSGSFSYSPMCMQIAAGQSVTFSGDFSVHPLTPGTAPGAAQAGSADNPIPSGTSGSTTVTVKFPTAGMYPYFCHVHFSAGMIGAIQVTN